MLMPNVQAMFQQAAALLGTVRHLLVVEIRVIRLLLIALQDAMDSVLVVNLFYSILPEMLELDFATFTVILVHCRVLVQERSLQVIITFVMTIFTRFPAQALLLLRCPFRSLRARPLRRQRLLLLPALTAQQPAKQ